MPAHRPEETPTTPVDLAEAIRARLRERSGAPRAAAPTAGPAGRSRAGSRSTRGDQGGRHVRQYAFRRS